MNILAIDTTTKTANVSVLVDNIISSKSIDNEITHSEKLLPLIDDVLNESKITLKDVDLFAVTTGPGSFTGIRIGLATLKAFAKVHSKKIFAINSLEVMAYSKITDGIDYIISMMDARNSRVYYTVYKIDFKSGLPTLTNDFGFYNDIIDIAADKIQKYFENISNNNIIVTGDIAENHSSNLCIKNCNLTFSDTKLDTNTVLEIINNELELYKETSILPHICDYQTLDATYMRSSEAERTKYGE